MQQQPVALAIPISSNPVSGTHRLAEQRAVSRLATLVGDVAARLEAPVDDVAHGAIGECNAALEVYLELQREVDDRDQLAATAADDLKRLAWLLTVVERPDVPLVLRQIRRVLGRLDLPR